MKQEKDSVFTWLCRNCTVGHLVLPRRWLALFCALFAVTVAVCMFSLPTLWHDGSAQPVQADSAFWAPREDKLDLNTATAAELETLEGIGPKKAQSILAYREANGPFDSVDDLKQVSGISEKIVENLRNNVCVTGK